MHVFKFFYPLNKKILSPIATEKKNPKPIGNVTWINWDGQKMIAYYIYFLKYKFRTRQDCKAQKWVYDQIYLLGIVWKTL